MTDFESGLGHLDSLMHATSQLQHQLPAVASWGRELAVRLSGGGRLLAAGNGGSAAQAQHLTAEIVGRYRRERAPLSAIALHADTSSVTAILNDYGPEEVFARQVEAHGRSGDVCVFLSTSGSSRNVVLAAERANEFGLHTWALTGRAPNALVSVCDESLAVDAAETATVQELHLVLIHLLCEALDDALLGVEGDETHDPRAWIA